MARSSTPPLDEGQPFPTFGFGTVAHGHVVLPGHFQDTWGVLLLYRGHWCGYCRRQLAEFEAALDQLAAERVRVVAASADALEHATTTAQALRFPVGFGLSPEGTSAALGTFREPAYESIGATGYLVRPTGYVAVATYSTGPIGRLTPADVIGCVRYYDRVAAGAP